MPRSRRLTPGGYVYHVLNRGNNRQTLFEDEADYAAFLGIVAQVMDATPMRLLSYCIMPNHWHMVLWPRADGDLGRFMQRLTVTHARRWQLHRHCVGHGHVYQGLYKSFPVQADGHLVSVCRYVERNALRAKLVRRAEQWPWCSLRQLQDGTRGGAAGQSESPALTNWPNDRPRRTLQAWIKYVNEPMTVAEQEAMATSIQRGRPLGDAKWQKRVAGKLDLSSTFRPRGRPRKEKENQ